jgi:hypothetical protein
MKVIKLYRYPEAGAEEMSLCKAMVSAGAPVNDTHCHHLTNMLKTGDLNPDQGEACKELLSWFKFRMEHPASLLDQSRLAVRNALITRTGKVSPVAVDKLPIPQQLKDYIRLLEYQIK